MGVYARMPSKGGVFEVIKVCTLTSDQIDSGSGVRACLDEGCEAKSISRRVSAWYVYPSDFPVCSDQSRGCPAS